MARQGKTDVAGLEGRVLVVLEAAGEALEIEEIAKRAGIGHTREARNAIRWLRKYASCVIETTVTYGRGSIGVYQLIKGPARSGAPKAVKPDADAKGVVPGGLEGDCDCGEGGGGLGLPGLRDAVSEGRGEAGHAPADADRRASEP